MRDQRLTRLFLRFRAQGDTHALGELFDALSPELLRVARHVARDEAEAEDLVQATFLTAMERAERFDASARITAWMVGILTKEARAWGRGAARRPDPERVLAEPLTREERERPEQLALDRESRSLLEAALERLPATYRDVLAAHLLRRQSPQEIAAERACPAGTIRVQLHRGLAQLRPLLPAGLSGALVMTLAPRGSAALRSELLASASRLTPVAASATAGTAMTTLGGLLMLQRIGLGALVALALVGLWAMPPWLEVRDAGAAGSETLAPPGASRTPERNALASETNRSRSARSEAAPATSVERDDMVPIGGLRVAAIWQDGSPAADLRVECRALAGGANGVAPTGTARTDAGGVARFLDLPAGSYVIYGDRGGHATGYVIDARVPADRSDDAPREELLTDIELAMPHGLDVRGRVVDAEGVPVGGAEIWITTGISRDRGSRVATSAANGSYFARQLSNGCFFGARADGHAPSRPEHVQYWGARSGGSDGVEVELRLGGPDASVSGVVREPSGAPAAHAVVRVGAQDLFDTFGPRGAEGPPPPLELVADEHGRFEARGIAPGQVEVAARHADPGAFPVAAERIEVAAGESGQIELSFVPGAWVEGVVHDDLGQPVDLTELAASQDAFRLPNPRSSFDEPVTVCDDEGRYVLGPLAPGVVRLRATKHDRSSATDTELELAPGEHVTWHPILASAPLLSGTATDANGAPLVGWSIVGRTEQSPGPPPRAAFTDEDGRFELRFGARGTVVLTLYPPKPELPPEQRWYGRWSPHSWLEGVSTDARDVEFALDPMQAPTAQLVVLLATDDGLEAPELLAVVEHERWGLVWKAELPAGSSAVEVDELPAGTITLRLEGEGVATVVREDVRLEDQRTTTLERIVLGPSGALRVDLSRADGGVLEGLDVELTGEDGTAWWLGRDPSALERDDLPAGRYRLRVYAADCGPVLGEVVVTAGERTTHRVDLVPGGSLGLALVDAEGGPLGATAQLTIETAAGRPVADLPLEPDERGHVSRWLFAPFGELRIRAEAADGRRGEATHRLSVSTPSGAPLVLRLE